MADELYLTMLEARRHKISGPLAHTMIDIAQKSLELWWRDDKTAMCFAAGVLAGPTNLRATTGQLPEPVASACWRLIGLLEYHHGRQPPGKNILQPPRLLEGARAIEKLASAAKISEDLAWAWLKKQAIWQIYLPAPRRVPRPKFDVAVPNEVHQADLLFLPHGHVGQKTFRYALTVVDVASSYKEALTSKTAAEVANALSQIYRWGPLKWLKLL